MGFLDRLVGRPPAGADEEPSAASTSGSGSSQQQTTTRTPSAAEVLHDLSPGASSSPFAGVPGGGGAGGGGGGSGSRLYDPYEGISAAAGGRHAAFALPEGPEFVFQDEAAARRRGWGENLQFYTGLGYLGGGATGFAIGGYRYLSAPPAEPALATAKLKANRLINMSGSLGRRFACASAILGLYFSSFEAGVFSASDGLLPDGACTAAAGFLTAALFRSPRGPRTAAVAGAVGAAAAAGLHAARQKWPSL